MQLLVCVVLFMHAVYVWIVYLIGIRQKALIYFSLLIICVIFMILVDDDKLLLVWLPLGYAWNVKLLFISSIGVTAFLLQFVRYHFPEYSALRAFHWFSVLCLIAVLLILFTPVTYTLFASSLYGSIIFSPFWQFRC